MRAPMQRITLEVICRLVFGAERPPQTAELRDALAQSLSFSKLAPLLFFPRLFDRPGRLNPASGFLGRREEVHRLITALIDERRRSADLDSRDDVLSLLISAGGEGEERFSDEELRDQLMTLLVAGHETTATALAWSLERLSRNPQARERLTTSVLADDDEYLNAVIQETLRVRPPIVNVPRTTTAAVELGGRHLDPGTPVAAMLALTHRRADIWPDPLEFKPERFLNGKPAPYSFTPFGGGIRRCIGASLALLEMRVVLRTMVRRFAIEAAPGHEEKIRLIGPVLAPSKGGRVTLSGADLGD